MKKVAVVGFGFMGMTHTVNLLKLSGVELVAIVVRDINGLASKLSSESGNFSTGDIDEETIQSINKYNSLEECLLAEQLDAVHICVHTDLHFDMTKTALSNGINVFLEKPMVLDVARGEELIKLAGQNNCLFMVGHVVRFMSPYEKLKTWIEKQSFGKLKFLSLTRFSGVPAWGQWKEKQQKFGSSGGALFDLVIHDIDYANYLFGVPDQIESIYLPGTLSVHDYVSANWSFKDSDIKVKIEGGNIFHSSFPFQAGFMASFDKASIQYTTMKPEIIQIADNEKVSEISAEDGTDGFFNEIEYFYQCLEDQVQPEKCQPESSLETIKICYSHIEK